MTSPSSTVRIIKKYPNRRLYDTQTSAYITLSDVKGLVLSHEQFQVVDARSSEDLTRSVLLQIILEEEAVGTPIFSSQLLSEVIRFYGTAMQGMMGRYLEKNLETFLGVQRQLQDQASRLGAGMSGATPEAWTRFMAGQAPMMQSLMSNYLDQSQKVFLQMEQQMQSGARDLLTRFGPTPEAPFGPSATPSAKPSTMPSEPVEGSDASPDAKKPRRS